MQLKSGAILGVLLLANLPNLAIAQKRVLTITKAESPVRLKKSATGTVIATAARGECFRYVESSGSWHGVYLPSGEMRYVAKADGDIVDACQHQAPDLNVLRAAAREAGAAEDKATREAVDRFPNDFDQQIDLERMLADRYRLAVLRKYKIMPTDWHKVVTAR